ncbi:MAG: Magnesium or manganese-dependent protein phosphatase [Streptosporangiaceae bacterium]|nr:Magnesium or manganese-dependent protein phosphatase [Streptosporangiaceae bacterium]
MAGARRYVREQLTAAGIGPEDVELAASELVTNAVRYGGQDPIELVLSIDDRTVRIEVMDGGEGTSLPRVCPEPGGEQGRGLVLVEFLAERWGARKGPGGLMVWADFLRTRARTCPDATA